MFGVPGQTEGTRRGECKGCTRCSKHRTRDRIPSCRRVPAHGFESNEFELNRTINRGPESFRRFNVRTEIKSYSDSEYRNGWGRIERSHTNVFRFKFRGWFLQSENKAGDFACTRVGHQSSRECGVDRSTRVLDRCERISGVPLGPQSWPIHTLW